MWMKIKVNVYLHSFLLFQPVNVEVSIRYKWSAFNSFFLFVQLKRFNIFETVLCVITMKSIITILF